MNRLMDRWVSWLLERETHPPDWTNALALLALILLIIVPSIAEIWVGRDWRAWLDLPTYAIAGAGAVHLSGLQRRRAYARGRRDGAREVLDLEVLLRKRGEA